MVGLFRWLTILTWLMWFAVYWGAGTRSYFTQNLQLKRRLKRAAEAAKALRCPASL